MQTHLGLHIWALERAYQNMLSTNTKTILIFQDKMRASFRKLNPVCIGSEPSHEIKIELFACWVILNAF